MLIGNWKSIEELEESLTLRELDEILNAARKQEHAKRKFAAALKGWELPDWEEEQGSDVSFDDVKRRVEAKTRGVPEEAIALEEIGFAFISED